MHEPGGPPAELGALFEGTSAHRSWSVGASCNGIAEAVQAASAGAGHNSIGNAGQTGSVGAGRAGREYRSADGLAAAAVGQEEPKTCFFQSVATHSISTADQMSSVLDHHHHVSKAGVACPREAGLSSGGSSAGGIAADVWASICKDGKECPQEVWLSPVGSSISGIDADVKALVSGVSASKRAAAAGVAVTPRKAADEGMAPMHSRPVSDPSKHSRDPMSTGMASGRPTRLEDCSLGRMRTSISKRLMLMACLLSDVPSGGVQDEYGTT
eukprot:1157571-Pelagomonas_calceolata.AAC.1